MAKPTSSNMDSKNIAGKRKIDIVHQLTYVQAIDSHGWSSCEHYYSLAHHEYHLRAKYVDIVVSIDRSPSNGVH